MKHGPDCIPPDEVGDSGMCCCNGEWDDEERADEELVLNCGLDGCCMPGYHLRSECHTAEMIQAMEDEYSPVSEKAIFEFLCRKYVQRSDQRQKAMGLQYTEAETHDLAQELAAFFRASHS